MAGCSLCVVSDKDVSEEDVKVIESFVTFKIDSVEKGTPLVKNAVLRAGLSGTCFVTSVETCSLTLVVGEEVISDIEVEGSDAVVIFDTALTAVVE